MRYSGAGYLAFLGLREIARRRHSRHRWLERTETRLVQTFWRAALCNVLNPKVAVFFLAFLPQFVRPERGHLVLQFVVLGGIVSTVGLLFGALLAVIASRAHTWLQREWVARWQARVTGAVLLGLGVRLATS
jgi:threonine/homoserine/homoserine lactone efflux protein